MILNAYHTLVESKCFPRCFLIQFLSPPLGNYHFYSQFTDGETEG